MISACLVIGGSLTWNHFQSRQSIAPSPAIATPIDNDILELAAKSEAERIKSIASLDPECSVSPDPIGCFTNRLTAENNEAIAKAVLRHRALELIKEGGE